MRFPVTKTSSKLRGKLFRSTLEPRATAPYLDFVVEFLRNFLVYV